MLELDLIHFASLGLKIESAWEATFVLVQYVGLHNFACMCVQLCLLFGHYHAGQPLSEPSVCFLELRVGTVVDLSPPRGPAR